MGDDKQTYNAILILMTEMIFILFFFFHFQGLHISTGADTSLIEKDSEFPKQFFYGTYKFHTKFLKNKDMYGCFVLIVEIKRPWEKE